MGGQTRIDYRTSVRAGIGGGTVLFVGGLLGHIVGPALLGSLPEWETTLFTLMEATGILIAMLAVFVFGIAVPLVE